MRRSPSRLLLGPVKSWSKFDASLVEIPLLSLTNMAVIPGIAVPWSRGGYDIDNVVICRIEGSTFPHSGRDVKVTEYDCCPHCWEKIVKPFLDQRGNADVYELVDGKRYEVR